MVKGQGATEYLVLLAVVLIVALVSVALLGFFPGMAMDSQIAESQIYWKSASPISIVEVRSAKYYNGAGYLYSPLYMRLLNSGAYPIRITKLVSPSYEITVLGLSSGMGNISDYFYLAPGEERAFATPVSGMMPSGGTELRIHFSDSYSSSNVLRGAKQYCTDANNYVIYDSLGFEYVQYVEGQQITKKQMGSKPLVFRCN